MAVPLCLLVGVVIGAVNDFLILKLRLNGFIVTLGMLTMLRGLQVALSEGQSIVELPSSFTYLGKASWLGMPAAIWICVLLFAIGAGALAWLRHGRALYAIGGNAEAARTAGIRVDRIVWIVLILCSVLAAFAGILYSGHYGSISATQGSGWIFQVFAATVIGGVSLNGGKGSTFGALTGVLTLAHADHEQILSALQSRDALLAASAATVHITAVEQWLATSLTDNPPRATDA